MTEREGSGTRKGSAASSGTYRNRCAAPYEPQPPPTACPISVPAFQPIPFPIPAHSTVCLCPYLCMGFCQKKHSAFEALFIAQDVSMETPIVGCKRLLAISIFRWVEGFKLQIASISYCHQPQLIRKKISKTYLKWRW